MLEVRYDKRSWWIQLITVFVIAFVALYLAHFVKDARLFSPITLTAGILVFGGAALRIMLADGIALSANHTGILISGVFRKQRYDWTEITDIDLVRITSEYKGKPAPASATTKLRFTLKEPGKEAIMLSVDNFQNPHEAPAILAQLRMLRDPKTA